MRGEEEGGGEREVSEVGELARRETKLTDSSDASNEGYLFARPFDSPHRISNPTA